MRSVPRPAAPAPAFIADEELTVDEIVAAHFIAPKELDPACSRMVLGSTGTESRRTCRPGRSCRGMPGRGRPLTPSADVASTWLRPAESAKALIGGTTDQRLETEPNRIGVRLGAAADFASRRSCSSMCSVFFIHPIMPYAYGLWLITWLAPASMIPPSSVRWSRCWPSKISHAGFPSTSSARPMYRRLPPSRTNTRRWRASRPSRLSHGFRQAGP